MHKKTLEAGFTIVELVIAVGVLGAVLLGVMSAMTTTATANRETYELSRSQNVARQVMEQILAVPYVDLLGMAGQAQLIMVGKFRSDCVVNQVQQGLLAIEVVVTDANTGGDRVRLTTLRAQR